MDVRLAIAHLKAQFAMGRVVLSDHAESDKLSELGLFAGDVEHIVQSLDGGILESDDQTRWKLYGNTADDERMALVVDFRADGFVWIVTIHPFP